jgi:hypothetical protein
VRPTDQILYAKSCHETDRIDDGRERVALVSMELDQMSEHAWQQREQPHSSKHRDDRHIPDLSKNEFATMSRDYDT